MKTFLVTFISLGLCLGIQAQSTDTIYSYVDTMPEYKDGEAAFMRQLSKAVKYPAINAEDDIPAGKMTIRFVVNEDGTTSNFKLVNTDSTTVSQEVIRVLKAMHFKPGVKDGKPVKVYYTLPMHICFKAN